MSPKDFNPASFEPAIHRLWLEFKGGGDTLRLPLLLARGAADGPVLGMTAAIHGDEYEGVGAIYELFESLNPAELSGSILAIPVANPPAYFAITRTSPLDGANLARVFPGKEEGTASEAIADAIRTAVIGHADFFIDLHSAGVRYWMPTMAGYYTGDPRSLAAARAFGAPVIWGHDLIPPGRTLSSAKERGIPFLYTEARGAGRIADEDAIVFRRGLKNLAKHLGIMPGELEPTPAPLHLLGDGNVDEGLAANYSGFFVPEVKPLQYVTKGTRVGRLLHLDGTQLEEYLAPVDGIATMLRMAPSVLKDEPLFLFSRPAEK